MRSWTIPIAMASLVWMSGAARADQCQLVDDAVAVRAEKALAGHPEVVAFCEPCGDRAPGEPVTVEHVATSRDTTGDYVVVVDKREVDLAYLYVQTSPAHYENVAALAGCPTSGVSPSLRVDDATATGVMITADSTPVTPPPPVIQPPPITMTINKVAPTNWLAILLACSATSALWAFATMAILRRRRVAMRPRAVDLVDRR